MGLNFFRAKQEKFFLVLDIGTEAVKALSCKRENGKIVIVDNSIQYFERYGVFDGRDFEKDVIKKAILKALQNFASQNLGGQALEDLPVIIGLPANIFKARIAWQTFSKKEPKKKISASEENFIYQEVLKKAQKEISERFAKNSGILPEELEWISQKILEIKIDGYSVSRTQGYQGKNLEFKILATFLPKYYLENIKKIFKDLKLKISKIVHPAENLEILWGEKKINSLFLDIGGEVSQVFLVNEGKMDRIFEFRGGGKFFSQRLSEKLGLDQDSARNLKEKYSNGFLSLEVSQRIKEIFLEEKKAWQKHFPKGFLPKTCFLFGGGSLLPEIQLALKEKGKELNPVRDYGNSEETQREEISNRVKFIYPKDLKDIEDSTKNLKSPQYIPPLLISYYV